MKRFAAALLMICMTFCLPAFGERSERAQIGTDVSGFCSELIDGTPVDGSVFAYRYSVVTYWATWQQGCFSQMSALNEIAVSHPEYGVFGLLAVDATSTPAAAAAFMEQNGFDFPVFTCDDIWQSVVDQTMYIPQSYIVNDHGVIVEAWQAAFTTPDTLLERLAFWSETAPAETPEPTETQEPTETPGPTEAPAPDGDVNLDGSVEATDALLALRFALEMQIPTEENIAHGDMDMSGAIEATDALIILRMTMGIQ